MRRLPIFVITATVAVAGIGLTVANSQADGVGWTTVECASGQNNAPRIERALADNNVRLRGFCGVDWSHLGRNDRYWAGVEIPNYRNLEVGARAVLFLRPNQAVVPAAPDGSPSTEWGDLIVNRDQPAFRVAITGTGVIDGMAADQRGGNGYDGIQLQDASDSTVWGVTIRNIRGVDRSGGPTESFAVQYLNSVRNNTVVNVKVTTTSAAHRQVSSTGIATNGGTDVEIMGSNVSQLHGRCYSSWRTANVVRRNNVGDGCDGAAFGNEFGTGARDYNNWYVNSAQGLDLLSETDYQGTGMVFAGNRGHGIRFNGGCQNVVFRGEVFPHPRAVFGGVLDNCSFTDQLARRG